MNESNHRRSTRGRWYAAGALAGLAAVLAVAFWPESAEVDTAVVDRGAVRSTVVDEGRTRMHDIHILKAPVSGRLLRIDSQAGDRVQRNDLIARLTTNPTGFLDPRLDAEARAAVAAAEARLSATRVERDQFAADWARSATLHRQRLLADAAYEAAQNRWRTAEAAVLEAEAQLRRARTAMLTAGHTGSGSALALRSPVAGVVLELIEEGESPVVAGTPIVRLGDSSQIDVIVDVLSQEAVRIRAGDAAVVENWGERALDLRPVEAVVERVEPVARTRISALGIEEQRVRIVLKFTEAIPPPLRTHDYRVDVRIVVDAAENATRVPLGALFRTPAGWAVYVVEGNRARLRSVTPGLSDGRHTQITAGLRRGERVVLFPSSAVADGGRVRARR